MQHLINARSYDLRDVSIQQLGAETMLYHIHFLAMCVPLLILWGCSRPGLSDAWIFFWFLLSLKYIQCYKLDLYPESILFPFALGSQHSQGVHWGAGWERPPSRLLQEALHWRRDGGQQDLQLCAQDSGEKTSAPVFLSVGLCLTPVPRLQLAPCSHGGRIHPRFHLLSRSLAASLRQTELNGVIPVCSQERGWTSRLIISPLCRGGSTASCRIRCASILCTCGCVLAGPQAGVCVLKSLRDQCRLECQHYSWKTVVHWCVDVQWCHGHRCHFLTVSGFVISPFQNPIFVPNAFIVSVWF